MEDAEVIGRLEGIIRPLLEGEGAELVDITLGGGRRRRALRVFVDCPGGITIDECARLNRLIGGALDIEDPIDGSYLLEVSSPGLDRLLKTDKDFNRYTGRKIRVILTSGVTHVGLLRGAFGETIVLEVDGSPVNLPRDQIAKANLEVEF